MSTTPHMDAVPSQEPLDPLRLLRDLVEGVHKCLTDLAAMDRASAASIGLYGCDIAYQIQAIEREMAESRSLAIRVRHRVWGQAEMRHNCQVPVNHLPTEVLCRIFELVQGDQSWPETPVGLTFRSESPRRPRRGRNKWIGVTAVCVLWKEIAYGHPFLWSTIHIQKTEHPEYYLEWIRRSGDVSLDILIDDFEYARNLFAKELPSWCSRLRRLEIRRVRLVHTLSSFKEAAPLLQSLTLITTRPEVPLPTDLFFHHTPRLRDLALNNMFCPLPDTYSNLSHIVLRSPYRITVAILVTFLRAHPRLESLVMCWTYWFSRGPPGGETVVDDGESAVQLPALKHLALKRCDKQILRTILSRVVGSQHNVAIYCDVRAPCNLPMQDIFPPVARSRIAPLLGVRALKICDRQRTTVVAVSTSSVIKMCGEVSGPRSLIPELHTIMALHALQELRIVGGASRSSAWWREELGHMPSLTKIVFERSKPEVLEMLGDILSPFCPAPSLHTVVLIPNAFNDDWEYAHTLTGVLAIRRASGHQIRTLQIVCEGGHAKVSPKFSTRTFDNLRERKGDLETLVDEVKFDYISDGMYPPFEIPGACRAWMDGAHV